MLYKIDSKKKIRVWDIFVSSDKNGWFYETSSGVKDGAMQNFKVYVKEGKNKGRSNETTPEQQCRAEAESLKKKQIERKGYTESIPEKESVRPMLAYTYEKYSDNISFPCMVQPKLDGCRVMAYATKETIGLFSRQGKRFAGLTHLERSLFSIYNNFGDTILDGELFCKDLTFQQITSLVKKTKNFDKDSEKIEMWVYDLVPKIATETYHQRYINMSYITCGADSIVQTPTFIIKSPKEIDFYHKNFTSDGFEGTMIRNLNGLYKCGARSTDLLKYKDFIDEEFEVVSYKTGKGRFSKIPTFILKTKSGTNFEAVPIGTQEEREQYLNDAKSYIGKFCTVKFFEYTSSESPVPRFPVITEMDRQT